MIITYSKLWALSMPTKFREVSSVHRIPEAKQIGKRFLRSPFAVFLRCVLTSHIHWRVNSVVSCERRADTEEQWKFILHTVYSVQMASIFVQKHSSVATTLFLFIFTHSRRYTLVAATAFLLNLGLWVWTLKFARDQCLGSVVSPQVDFLLHPSERTYNKRTSMIPTIQRTSVCYPFEIGIVFYTLFVDGRISLTLYSFVALEQQEHAARSNRTVKSSQYIFFHKFIQI